MCWFLLFLFRGKNICLQVLIPFISAFCFVDTSLILLSCSLRLEFSPIHRNMSPRPIHLITAQCVCSLCGRKTYSLWPVSTSFAAAAGSSIAQYLSRTAWVWESLAWLRTAHSGHQRTSCFHCCPMKNWETNIGATSSGTMWKYDQPLLLCLLSSWAYFPSEAHHSYFID